jgi:hypothetical protein
MSPSLVDLIDRDTKPFDEKRWAAKLLKIVRSMYKMEKHKYSDPYLTSGVKGLAVHFAK